VSGGVVLTAWMTHVAQFWSCRTINELRTTWFEPSLFLHSTARMVCALKVGQLDVLQWLTLLIILMCHESWNMQDERCHNIWHPSIDSRLAKL
jgi:hypothetical protein